ncbi:hypothetical protein BLS_002409 [Venturia inaequalis]|uniref:Pisatin demethylase n=1 Tax=Venturia inaequalis TaxID=5025 RepID=A0A8H3YVT0_VENIN|nr:hypothetical protein BLS_002409 [Venturia inaequalis]
MALPLLTSLLAFILLFALNICHHPGIFPRLWTIISTARNTLHLDHAAVLKEYGPLARIDPNTLITNDPELIRRMNAVRSLYQKGEWYDLMSFTVDRKHLFSETNEERHSALRARMAQGYSGSDLGNAYLEECVDGRLLDLFSLISAKYLSSGSTLRSVDISRLMLYLAADVVTDIAFREPFGFLTADDDVHGYITTQEELLPVFEWFSAIPAMAKLVKNPWIAKYAMPKNTDKAGLGYMLGVAKRTVDQRFGPNKISKNDMLGSFISHGLDREQCEQEAVLQVVAGTDTTVTSLRTITMYIITHPQVYRKLQDEIDKAQLTFPILTDKEAKNLPYLQACIAEGLRIFPPVTGLFCKRVPPEGDTIHGKFIPGGTEIAYGAWNFYKDAAIFGNDVDVFRPERWLEATEEQAATMRKTTDLIFGYGKYQCLGKPIAMLELGKALAEIFRRYDISLVDPLKGWKCYNRNATALNPKQLQLRTLRKLIPRRHFLAQINSSNMVIDSLQIGSSTSSSPKLRQASKRNGVYWFTKPRLPPVSGPPEEDQARVQLQPRHDIVTIFFPYR